MIGMTARRDLMALLLMLGAGLAGCQSASDALSVSGSAHGEVKLTLASGDVTKPGKETATPTEAVFGTGPKAVALVILRQDPASGGSLTDLRDGALFALERIGSQKATLHVLVAGSDTASRKKLAEDLDRLMPSMILTSAQGADLDELAGLATLKKRPILALNAQHRGTAGPNVTAWRDDPLDGQREASRLALSGKVARMVLVAPKATAPNILQQFRRHAEAYHALYAGAVLVSETGVPDAASLAFARNANHVVLLPEVANPAAIIKILKLGAGLAPTADLVLPDSIDKSQFSARDFDGAISCGFSLEDNLAKALSKRFARPATMDMGYGYDAMAFAIAQTQSSGLGSVATAGLTIPRDFHGAFAGESHLKQGRVERSCLPHRLAGGHLQPFAPGQRAG